jgi:hypothetical protein
MTMSEPPSDDEPPGRFEAWARFNDAKARLGIGHLTKAFLDPHTEFNRQPSWILNEAGDHDLDRLRRHPRFTRWKAEMRFDKASDPSPDQKERDELNHAWTNLNQVATALSQDGVWTALQQTLLAPNVSKLTITQWCEREQALWLALAAWARRPRQMARWDRFRLTALETHEGFHHPTLTAASPTRSDWRDPEVTAAHHRACWASVGETATAVAEVWKERAQRVTGGQSDEQIRNWVEAWIEDSWGLWECLARCSRAPLRRAHYDELSSKAQRLAPSPNGSQTVGAPEGS